MSFPTVTVPPRMFRVLTSGEVVVVGVSWSSNGGIPPVANHLRFPCWREVAPKVTVVVNVLAALQPGGPARAC